MQFKGPSRIFSITIWKQQFFSTQASLWSSSYIHSWLLKNHLLMSLIHSLIVVQSLSHGQLFATPWTAAHQASLAFIVSQGLLKLMSIESVMPPSHLVSCHSLLLMPSVFPSIGSFQNDESVLHIRWPKYWSFSFSINPSSNEYSGFISFRIDWFDFLAVHRTLSSLLQHHSLKAPVFSTQPSYIHIHTSSYSWDN